MKNTRRINKKNFSKIGVAISAILVITTLAEMLINGFVYGKYSGGNVTALVFDTITLLFYFIVLNNYRLSANNLYQGYYASLLIIISDFVLPLILSFIQGLFNLTLIIPSVTLVVVLIYFIFLTLENKRRRKADINNLKIVGIITGIVMLASGINGFVSLFRNGLVFNSWADYLILPVRILSLFATTIGLPIIFAYYPFVLYKERYL